MKASDGPLRGPVDRVEHAYDEYGREVSCTVAGATWAKAFDVLGRLDAETDPLGYFGYSYDGNTGRVSAVQYPNGQSTVYGYYGNVSPAGTGNGDRRLSSITHVLPGVSGTLSRFDYGYAPAGDITAWTQTQGSAARLPTK